MVTVFDDSSGPPLVRPLNVLAPIPQPQHGAFSYAVELNGRFIYAQPQLCTVLRRTLDELRGQDSGTIMRPGENLLETAAEVVEIHKAARAKPGVAIPLKTYISPFGRRIYLYGSTTFDAELHGGAFIDTLSYDLEANGAWIRTQGQDRFRASIRAIVKEELHDLAQQPRLLDVPKQPPERRKHITYTQAKFDPVFRSIMEDICAPWGERLTVTLICKKLHIQHPATLKDLLRDYGYSRTGESPLVTLKRLKAEWFPQWT